jgi:hypothetical protein
MEFLPCSGLRPSPVTRRSQGISQAHSVHVAGENEMCWTPRPTRALWVVPGGGVEPPRPEGRRILSVTPQFRKSHCRSIFRDLRARLQRDRCSSERSCAALLHPLCAHCYLLEVTHRLRRTTVSSSVCIRNPPFESHLDTRAALLST